jgi:hypothetical protein
MRRRTVASALALLTLAACSVEINAPVVSLEGLPEGLHAAITVQPGEVDRHEDFTARLTITNTTAQEISIVTNHGCLAIPAVYRGGELVPLRGSWWACTAAITRHSFAPGETRSMEWQMRAELYAQHPGDVDGLPAPRGTYSVRAEFDVAPIGPDRWKPSVEAALRVR